MLAHGLIKALSGFAMHAHKPGAQRMWMWGKQFSECVCILLVLHYPCLNLHAWKYPGFSLSSTSRTISAFCMVLSKNRDDKRGVLHSLTGCLCAGPALRELLIKLPFEKASWPKDLKKHGVYKIRILTVNTPTYISTFARESLVRQWQFLHKAQNHCVILGPPGTGKSTLAHAWCQYCHCELSKDIAYVCLSVGIVWLAILQKKEDESQYFVGRTVDGVNQPPVTIIRNLLRDFPKISLIVIDGLRNNDHSEYWVGASTDAFASNNNLKFIFLSSVQVSIKWDTLVGFSAQQMCPPFESWNLEEYEQACKDASFWTQVSEFFDLNGESTQEKIKNAVNDKHFYAGGSARWMFSYTIENICSTINTAIRKVSDFQNLWSQAGGDASKESVNSLIELKYVKGRTDVVDTSLISAYAFQALGQKAEPKVVIGMWNWAVNKGNAAVLGWAYEARCINEWIHSPETIQFNLEYLDTLGFTETILRSGTKRYSESETSPGQVKSLSLLISRKIHSEELGKGGTLPDSLDLSNSAHEDVALLPVLWNHGCFDIVFVKPTGVYCVQCTIQKKHSRKIGFINELLANLRQKGLSIDASVNLIGCVPKASYDDFSFEEYSEGSAEDGPQIVCWKTKHNFPVV